jgi:hypothetical protein
LLDFKFLDKYDEDNRDIFVGRKKGTFHCTCCGSETSEDGSYSNQGYHLVCCQCVNAVVFKHNIPVSKVLEMEVWNR